MTWAEIISDFKTGMEYYGYKRIEGIIEIEEDSEIPSSDINYKYTIRLRNIDSEGMKISNMFSFHVELKIGYVTKSNKEYDTEMDNLITLIKAIKNRATYFTEFVDYTDDPAIEEERETFRVVATLNILYGAEGCL